MGQQIADVCDECGRTVIKKDAGGSSGMLRLAGANAGGYLLLLADMKIGRSARPTFDLTDKLWCPGCLIAALQRWVNTKEQDDTPRTQ